MAIISAIKILYAFSDPIVQFSKQFYTLKQNFEILDQKLWLLQCVRR